MQWMRLHLTGKFYLQIEKKNESLLYNEYI